MNPRDSTAATLFDGSLLMPAGQQRHGQIEQFRIAQYRRDILEKDPRLGKIRNVANGLLDQVNAHVMSSLVGDTACKSIMSRSFSHSRILYLPNPLPGDGKPFAHFLQRLSVCALQSVPIFQDVLSRGGRAVRSGFPFLRAVAGR